MIKDYTETPTNAVYIGSYAFFRGEVPHHPAEGLVLGQTHRLARSYCPAKHISLATLSTIIRNDGLLEAMAVTQRLYSLHSLVRLSISHLKS